MKEDEHQMDKYCVQRFSVTKTYDTPVIMTLN